MTGQYGSGGLAIGSAAGGVLGGSLPNPTFASNGTSKILDFLSNLLAAPVTMTNANQYYDGPSVALTAGTWFCVGGVDVLTAGTGDYVTAKLWDGGTNVVASSAANLSNAAEASFAVGGVIVLAAPATVRVSAAGAGAGYTIRAAAQVNPAGNTSSYLYAVRIA